MGAHWFIILLFISGCVLLALVVQADLNFSFRGPPSQGMQVHMAVLVHRGDSNLTVVVLLKQVRQSTPLICQ